MILTGNEAAKIVYGDNDNWISVEETRTITGRSSCSIYWEEIFQYKPTGKFYKFEWSTFNYVDEYEPVEVEEVELLTKIWVPKDE